MADRVLLEDGTSVLLLEDGTSALLMEASSGTSQTASDSVTTSDAPTRAVVLTRSASDAVTVATSVARTDSPAAFQPDAFQNDAFQTGIAAAYTAADAVTTSDAATRTITVSRSAVDAVTSSDAAVAGRNITVTASDAVTVSSAVSRILVAHRTAASTVTIATSISRSGSFTYTIDDDLSALDRVGVSFPNSGTTTTIAIYVDGVNVTDDVVFPSCRFTSYVNSKPGEAQMRVRDSGRSYSFTTGADWLVMINGDAAWRGFLTSVVDTYIAPALNVDDFGPTRFFDLRGADMNLLFSRRVVYDQASPANVTGTQFPPGTPDTTAITELLADWLLLAGDRIDTSSGVTNVGDLDPAQDTRAWSGGWTWGNAMDTIAMLPAAIYYLRPEFGLPKATLCYVDVDIPTAPFGLSDVPDGTTTKGYREMEIVLDGSSMANDVMAWGMGYGSTVPVFDRETDATSQAAHGLWQTSITAPGVYKQATIDRMATSVIDGSPSSKRGAKNDKPSVRLVTYDPGLLAGHVVSFDSNVWDFSDDIPVRQMTLLFEGPGVARYEVVLSHEIDAPWSFIDQFWPDFPGPGGTPQPCLNPPCFPPPPPPPPPACPGDVAGCTGANDTDNFDGRTATSGWGTAPNGNTWSITVTGPGGLLSEWLVEDGVAIGTTRGSAGVTPNGGRATLVLDNPVLPGDIYVRFQTKFTPNDIPDAQIGVDPDQFAGTTYNLLTVTVGNPSGVRIGGSISMSKNLPDFPGDPPVSKTFTGVSDSNGLVDGNSGAESLLLTLFKNTWYVFHIHYEPGNTWSEIVDLDNSRTPGIPTVLTSLSASVRLTTTGPNRFTNNDLSPAPMPDTTGVPGWYWTNFDYVKVPYNCPDSTIAEPDCPPEDRVSPELPAAPSGYGCEEPIRSSPLVYSTRSPFVPETTFVWREGLFQRRDFEYTESPTNNSIVFDDPVDASEVIRMCYFTRAAGT